MEKIERVTADMMVAESLKQFIVQQNLAAGDRLPPETDLCKYLGVARHTLREGIKRLSQLGILESKSGSGTYVCESSYSKIEEYLTYLKNRREISKKEIYDVRIALESAAASAAAQNVTDAGICRLEAILNQMYKAVEASDYSKFVEYNVEFHNAITDISQNRLLIGITRAIQNLIRYSMTGTDADFRYSIHASYAGHVEIFHAIREHDSKSAGKAMTQHLLKSAKNKL